MSKLKKNYFLIFLSIYFICGAYFSVQNGLSHDEFHEQRNWDYNISLIKNFLFNTEIESKFLNYPDKYYGVGFQIISQPIQFLLKEIILTTQNVSEYGAHLLAKHFVVFITFFGSGIFVYLITKQIIKNNFFCSTVTCLYLLYPYLIGHGLFNPKDIPFLFFWISSTFVSLSILNKLLLNSNVNYKYITLIAFLTAILISTRISGVLIIIQYTISVLIYLYFKKVHFFSFIIDEFKKISFFLILVFLFIYIFHPVFWKNPLLIFEAISFMNQHFNNVCTLTLSKCMFSKSLNSTYIPIWMLVKLPIIVLLGLFLLPFTEKKIIKISPNILVFGTLLGSSFFIPLILILINSHLYDELRQILFLIPLIFILGVVSLYSISKKIFYTFSFISILLFTVENIKIYPYQYAWFNTPSRFLDLSKNFEIDYWGLSGRELALQFSKLNEKKIKKPCLLVSPLFLVKPFLDPNLYTCFAPWSKIDSSYERPFWAIQNVRNLKKGKSYNCDVVSKTKFNLLFYKKDLVTGKIIKCF